MIPVSRRLFMGASLAALVASGHSGAWAQAGCTLTIGTKLELNTLDPHFFNGFPQGSSHGLIFDALLALNDELNVVRSEEHTSELQSLMRISYAVFCLKKNKQTTIDTRYDH